LPFVDFQPDRIDPAGVLGREVHPPVRLPVLARERVMLREEAVLSRQGLEVFDKTAVRGASGPVAIGSRKGVGLEAGSAIQLDPDDLQRIGESHEIAGKHAPTGSLERAGDAGRAREGVAGDTGLAHVPIDGPREERDQTGLVSQVTHTGAYPVSNVMGSAGP
jgi:hypothetical protein